MAERALPIVPPKPLFHSMPNAVRAAIPLDALRRDYLELKLTQKEIGRRWGFTQQQVSEQIRRAGIPRATAFERRGRKYRRPPPGTSARHRLDLKPGDRFNRLTIIRYHHTDAKGRRYFLMRCQCGTVKVIQGSSAHSGTTQSCGCLRKERQSQAIKIPNDGAVINLIYNAYCKQAELRGYEWALTREQVDHIVRQPCHYCGNEGTNLTNAKRYTFRHNGIDRVDNALGYSTDNVVPACKFCNRAKGNRERNEFLEWAAGIARTQGWAA